MISHFSLYSMMIVDVLDEAAVFLWREGWFFVENDEIIPEVGHEGHVQLPSITKSQF